MHVPKPNWNKIRERVIAHDHQMLTTNQSIRNFLFEISDVYNAV